MSKGLRVTRVRFSALPRHAQRALFDEASDSWGRIFGVTPDDLERYWFEDKSRKTIIYVLRDAEGVIQGTVTVKYYDVVYRGRAIVIVKMGVAATAESRGNMFVIRCTMWELLTFGVVHYFDECYVFSTLIHPVTYQICTKFLSEYYPYYDRPQDPELGRLFAFLTDHFGLRRPEGSDDPLVFRELRAAVESVEHRERWRLKRDPAVRFFLERCPNYHEGDCLVILAPTPRLFLPKVAAKFIHEQIARRVTRRRA